MTPNRDKLDFVDDNTWLNHHHLLVLVNKIISQDKPELIREGTVGVIHIDPNNTEIDHNLSDIIKSFNNKQDQDKISIAICRGRLQKNLYGLDEITGSSHWTGLHLRKIKDAGGKTSIKAYHMDSCSQNVPVPVNRVLQGLNIADAVGVICNPQKDGHSCGYHSVCNLQVMHNLNSIDVGFNSLVGEINEGGVNKFIQDEKAWLRTKFNEHFATKLIDAKNADSKQKADLGEGEGSEEYLVKFLEIFSSNEFNNLDKLKRIIQIEDEVNKIKDAINRDMISSFLEFEKYYELFLRNFALDLQHKCSLTEELISEDEGVLGKRDIFFTKLTTEEVVKDPRKFLDILSTIYKNPKSIDTIGEIETDEDLKSEIDKRKKLFFKGITNNDVVGINYCFILRNEFDPMINRYYNSLRNEFDPIINGTFKERINKLPINIREVSKKKIFSFSQDFKDTFEFLYENDRENLIRAMIPDYYQLMPKEKFEGWGLKAVFNGMDLTIEGKEVSKINDENGKDILNELKQDEYYKANPKLFAQAVTDFFRRATGDIDLFYNGHPSEKLLQTEKKTLKIMGGKVTDCKEKPRNLCIDSMKLFNERLESYCESPTKTPEVTPPKKDNKTPVPPLPPQPPKLLRDRKYNLNLGANNIKRYGFLGENRSGSDKSGKANANNFIIVDPAGTAFEGIEAPLDQTGATAGSGALYKIFNTRPKMPTGKAKEGVKVNAKNEITTIEAGYAVYNNLSKPNNNFYGIIHAVGPDNQGEKQQGFLTQCLKNVFIEYDNEAKRVKEENRPGLRIPAISGNLYRNIIAYDKKVFPPKAIYQSDDDYNEMFRKALEEGYNEACIQLKKEIKFGQGLEICMYSRGMYNSMLGEITKVPNPAILAIGAKAMEPKVNAKGRK